MSNHKNIQDDIQIIGRSDSTLSQVKKPLNKQLQMEGTVNFVSVGDSTGTNAAGITIDGVKHNDYYGPIKTLTAAGQSATLLETDYHVECVGVASNLLKVVLPQISTLTGDKEYSFVIRGALAYGGSTVSIMAHGENIVNAQGDTIDGHGAEGSSIWYDNWINFYHPGTIIIRSVTDKNVGTGSGDGWSVIASTHYPSPHDSKGQVRMASTANVDLATIVVGGTIDGETVGSGDKVLLAGQTDDSENGIYHFLDDEPVARSHDLSVGHPAGGHSVGVADGTNAGKTYKCTSAHGADLVGTDDIFYTEALVTNNIEGVSVTQDKNIFALTTGGDINVGTAQTTADIFLGSASGTGKVKINTELNIVGKGAVTQITSDSTPVTLSKPAGKITTFALVLGENATTTFTVTNTLVAATSIVLASVVDYGGSGSINVMVDNIASGSFDIVLTNSSGTTLDAVAIIGFLLV